jgi:Putative Flp pilus-assembly TadE/G-like
MNKQDMNNPKGTRRERGVSLVLLSMSMLGVLGMSALAIDMVSFYMVRSAAQRAADSAAMAGAAVFVTSACTTTSSTPCSSSTVEALAKSEAESAGNLNLINGVSPKIVGGDISFTMTNASNPQVTVNVQLTQAHGNPVPTYFAKILGFKTVDVSANATAEVYNPSGAGSGMPGICLSCIKPVVFPNCDPAHTSPKNSSCTGSTMATFVNPPGSSNPGAISNPGVYPNGSIGESWLLETGSSSTKNSSSNQYFYEINLSGGASGYGTNVTACNATNTGCGDVWPTLSPTSVGVTNFENDWMNLINQDTICEVGGDNQHNLMRQEPGGNQNFGGILNPKLLPPCGNGAGGQDTISTSGGPPFTMTAGSNYPQPALAGNPVSSSDSVVTVPIYNGATLTPGSANVTIVGFMQVFITEVCDESSGGDLTAVILNLTGCSSSGSSGCTSLGDGGGGSGGSSTALVSGGGASPLPVRLVRGASGE